MNKELQYIIDILRFVFNSSECPNFDYELNFSEVYKICKYHHIESLVAYGLTKTKYKNDIDELVYKKFMDSWKIDLMIDSVQKLSMQELFTEFEKNHIEYVPLKGIYVKKYYPSSELRTMSDLDILFRPEQEDAVDHVMESLGYDCIDRGSHHHVYEKKPFMNVEMHLNLVDDNSLFDEYYRNIFSRLVKETEYKSIMNYSDFYVFHIAHFAKHFITSGCGIRFITDLYVLKTKIGHMIDDSYVSQELNKLKLVDFERNMCKLVNLFFSDKRIEGKYLDILLYMINSGVYGTLENSKINRVSLHKRTIKEGKYKLWILNVFRPLSFMRKYYPYVNKFPILLPVAWIHRWILNILKKGKCSEMLKKTFIADDIYITRKILLNDVGIKETYYQSRK